MVAKKVMPVIELTPAMKRRLEDSKVDIEAAEKWTKILKDVGMETKDMDEKIAWSKQVRETLLKEFT